MVLNGSYGEGGSATFRTALAVAALLQQPVRVHNVRGATRRPGLTSEDLSFLKAISESCAAEVMGDEIESHDVTWTPTRAPRPLYTRIDVQEHEKGQQPGNGLVIVESLLPVLARTGGISKLLVQGETYNSNTLTYEIFERVTLAAHRAQGLYVYPRQEVAGFGFAGRGELVVEVEPSEINPLEWPTRGALKSVHCAITLGELPVSIAERGLEHAAKLCMGKGLELRGEIVEVPSRSPGAYVSFWAHFERGLGSAGSLGARGVRVEHVVNQAFGEFAEWLDTDATVDAYLADQLLLPAVIAGETSFFKTSRITQRLVSMAWVIKQFLPIHITILGQVGEPGTVKVST